MAGLPRVRDGTVPIAWMQKEMRSQERQESHPPGPHKTPLVAKSDLVPFRYGPRRVASSTKFRTGDVSRLTGSVPS
jgi:hypothetical protein